jgi:hypothetical protein
MTKLQAEVWKSIISKRYRLAVEFISTAISISQSTLARNGDLLRTLAQGASMAKSGAKLMAKTNLNNTLMEIRK